jgi:hypothetical protein
MGKPPPSPHFCTHSGGTSARCRCGALWVQLGVEKTNKSEPFSCHPHMTSPLHICTTCQRWFVLTWSFQFATWYQISLLKSTYSKPSSVIYKIKISCCRKTILSIALLTKISKIKLKLTDFGVWGRQRGETRIRITSIKWLSVLSIEWNLGQNQWFSFGASWI